MAKIIFWLWLCFVAIAMLVMILDGLHMLYDFLLEAV